MQAAEIRSLEEADDDSFLAEAILAAPPAEWDEACK